MATKPAAKDYALPPSCTSPDMTGKLARHPEPVTLSVSERVMLYNQEVLFLQGEEILRNVAKLYANGAAAAAVDLGLGPTPGSGRAAAPTAADVGPAPAVGRAPVAPAAAAAVADVEVKVEKDDRIATPPPLTQPGPDEAIHGRRRAREDVRDNRKAGAAKAPKSKENLTDARSSETEESEQARNKAREISEAKNTLAEAIKDQNAVGRSNGWEEEDRTYFEERRQKALLRLQELGVAEETAHDPKVLRAQKAPVRKNAANNGAKGMHSFSRT